MAQLVPALVQRTYAKLAAAPTSGWNRSSRRGLLVWTGRGNFGLGERDHG